MSGIAGIFHRDGKPVSPAVLQSFARFLAYRGPDGQAIWHSGQTGFVHAQLQTTFESRQEALPLYLEERWWITADVRLDQRENLIAELTAAGRRFDLQAGDSELILQSYAVWSEVCVEHLRGDFAFAIWDQKERQLFCARDHFGVKPFYFAEFDELFLFSNTLNALRLHERVSDELDESAVGDFLLFGINNDHTATIFRDIRRIAPAHTLTISPDKRQTARYWMPPIDGRIRYRRPEEYVENFRTLLQSAVKDRLRTDRAGILLSGGMDSGTVAAIAKEVSATGVVHTDLRSSTFVYRTLFRDNEGEFAIRTADFLPIPNRQLAMDYLRPFDRWNDPEFTLPEPVDNPLIAGLFDQFRFAAEDGRVALSGEGADNLMDFQMWPYAQDLRRRGDWPRLLSEVARYLWIRPFPWRGIGQRALGVFAFDHRLQPGFPRWLAPEFVERMELRSRWQQYWGSPFAQLRHPIHRRGYDSLALPQWNQMFEVQDPGVTRAAVEVRYPFLDLRLVKYLLSLPPFPWFFDKKLEREAMRGMLPDSVLHRRKTPLRRDPLAGWLSKLAKEPGFPGGAPWNRQMNRFVMVAPKLAGHGKMEQHQPQVIFRPYCLNAWLISAGNIRYKE